MEKLMSKDGTASVLRLLLTSFRSLQKMILG